MGEWGGLCGFGEAVDVTRRERDADMIILDCGGYAVYLLCGRSVDGHQLLFLLICV